ncbi:N-acetyltransferase [Micromonospora craniellae]|uniref:N-acetyltransferase n=1 Tax=Micromonospora craniellae TaxID=2294034 RepID=A0A372FZH7_9ACTN|nr:GNAT family N-acetyltransferase [Micromonospora craniellae]RFS46034.1 N-acetyltransferase [Micromonospora craniellae]
MTAAGSQWGSRNDVGLPPPRLGHPQRHVKADHGVLLVSFDAATGVCEAGCWLEPAAEGRGLVTRAVERIIDWALVERGLRRVEWRTDAGNVRSIAVARRLGMRRDGVLRKVLSRPGGLDGRRLTGAGPGQEGSGRGGQRAKRMARVPSIVSRECCP